jgi:hypothetical protein
MRTFITTAAVLAMLSVPAVAEGDDPSAKSGESKGSVKASQEPSGSGAMGQGVVVPRATTGASRTDEQMNKTETSGPANPGRKTGVTTGNDGGGDSDSGSGSGGGSGGGGGGGGSGR